MKEDQGKGVKRKDDGDASLPAEETQERTDNQGERQQEEEKNDDVPMTDGDATPAKVNDDQANLGELQQITVQVFSDHSDPRVLNNWNGLPPVLPRSGLGCSQNNFRGHF